VQDAENQLQRADAQVNLLQQELSGRYSRPDVEQVRAQEEQGKAAYAAAQSLLQNSIIRAPHAGIVYSLPVHSGSFVNTGDLLIQVADLATVDVHAYVDEPDIARLAPGQNVGITWDAMPGRTWKGAVDKTPTQIVALGTRQVGEVLCVIDNPNSELLPGTNVNVEIQSEVIPNALTIPKEAVRRESGQTGVFTLSGNTLVWKKITLGVSNTTRTQVEGLNENDAVALPSEKPLKDGMIVAPRFQ